MRGRPGFGRAADATELAESCAPPNSPSAAVGAMVGAKARATTRPTCQTVATPRSPGSDGIGRIGSSHQRAAGEDHGEHCRHHHAQEPAPGGRMQTR